MFFNGHITLKRPVIIARLRHVNACGGIKHI